MLAFEPKSDGTDIKLALDTINQILKRRSILFLISDFLDEPENYKRSLFVANRKHDVIAVDLHDPLENNIADVGLLALEDAETGDIIWVDTSNRAWRNQFQQQTQRFRESKNRVLADAGVDRVPIRTNQDYVQALTLFFEKRAKRSRHKGQAWTRPQVRQGD